MKLSAYANKLGISYSTALRMWKRGELDAYQLPTGTIIVREQEEDEKPAGIVIYARVSSSSQKDDLERQVERLKLYALGNGYQMVLSLSERTYHCEACGMVKDRDRNAADNLKNTASSVGIQACGDAPLGVRRSRKLVAYGGV